MHLWIMLEERNTDVSKCINRYTDDRQVYQLVRRLDLKKECLKFFAKVLQKSQVDDLVRSLNLKQYLALSLLNLM